MLANNKKSKAVDAPSFLALDIGADSGRAVLGCLDKRRLKIKELNRFANGMVFILGHWHWNIYRIFEEVKKGIKVCASEGGARPQSIAFDTWGVDFALLGRDGSLLGLPYAYRDPRTEGAMEEFSKKVPRHRVYELTGIQFLQFNSLFQLFSMKRDNSPLLDAASDLLFMPDIFNYLFTREKKTEFTYATTSQLYNPRKKDWSDELFAALEISKSIMQKIVLPGTIIGRLDKSISKESGIGDIPVIAVASHDTGSAVGAVPAEGKDWAYISSGTWSLMGVETKEPVINDQALELNFTNEGGIGGTFRFLKNITGFWLLQECRRAWAKETLISYDELTDMAASAPPFGPLVEPDWTGFLNPADMPEAIRQFCLNTKQKIPNSPGEFVRCILESLALKYRHTLDQLRKVYPHPIRRVHVIGGGAKNRLLNQFTANATGLPVIAGPVEATAIGNIMVQALALGYFSSHSAMRKVIGQSFKLERYNPQQSKEWDLAYERFKELLNLI
jgi:rhamnulokinase